ncbi:hypothetical protein [Pseudaminobacter sp. NGMCC 1.201702]|uniref:hypothetical protein n=1 Tax=Pseudaminobacter sp. NGMCC 1.201702 TaxID=3391825 RepID=UPI0039EFE37E
MNLAKHADASAEIRRAADLASGLADELRALNLGPVFDRERDKRIENISMYFAGIAERLGYRVEAAQ